MNIYIYFCRIYLHQNNDDKNQPKIYLVYVMYIVCYMTMFAIWLNLSWRTWKTISKSHD